MLIYDNGVETLYRLIFVGKKYVFHLESSALLIARYYAVKAADL